MNLGIICFLPRKSIGHTDAFLANMSSFPSTNRILYYSHEWDVPGVIKLPVNPEQRALKKDDGKPNMVALFNIIFFTGLTIAAANKLTHFIYLEHDCRVNKAGWDEVLFKEFFRKNPDAACGGTPVLFNATSYSLEFARAHEKYVAANRARKMPLSLNGGGVYGQRHVPCLFPLAALAIYNVAELLAMFPEVINGNKVELAHKCHLHDQEIGRRLFERHGTGVFDQVVWLHSQYSAFKNILTTEPERQAMLESKQVVAIHSIKEAWPGPTPEAPKAEMPVSKLTQADLEKAALVLSTGPGPQSNPFPSPEDLGFAPSKP